MATDSKKQKPISPYWAEKYSTSSEGGEKKPSTQSSSARSSSASAKRTTGTSKSGKSSRSNKAKPRKKKRKSSKRITISIPTWVVWVILGLIAAFFLWPRYVPAGEETGDTLPPGSYKVGIDISHHNDHRIEWDSLMVMTDLLGRTTTSVKAARRMIPVSFVFMKATEGVSFQDSRFKSHWKQAASIDIQRGAYHFYRTNKDPHAQAKHFIKTVGELRYKDLPPVLDIETMHKGCTKKELNDGILAWLKEVESYYGVTPIVYTYESFARDYLSDDILSSYPIWIAHYGVKTPQRNDWMIWQFTDEGVVHGMRGKVDLSIMR